MKRIAFCFTAVLAVSALAPAQVYFEDTFDGNRLDSSKWNDNYAVSGQRWCSSESYEYDSLTAPGMWIDPAVDGCYGLLQDPPFGSIALGGGLASFSAPMIRCFPYIWAGPPSRSSPFPERGDFTFSARLRFSAVAGHGIHFFVLDWENTDPFGDNPPLPYDSNVLTIHVDWGGLHVGFLDQYLDLPGWNDFHTYTLQYAGGAYSLFFDGVLIAGPVESDRRPRAIWLGNPVFTWWGVSNWSSFEIDFIRVEIPQSPGNPPAPPFADDFNYQYDYTGDCYSGDHPCPDTYFPCALSPNKYWKKVSWLWEHRNKQGRLTGTTAILPENVTTDPVAGELILSAGEYYQPPLGCPSAPELTGTGGQIDSQKMFRYGSFRANIKASKPASNNWPIFGKGVVNGFFYSRRGHGEIDVEILSREQGTYWGVVRFAVHDGAGNSESKLYFVPFPLWQDYYLYGFDWYADRVDFVFDNKVVRTIYRNEIAIPSLAGQMILNNWSGNKSFGGEPPGENLEMRVEWVSYTP